jgi:[amino group carrier protein]-lysine/ornithine hydrolase
MSVEPVALLAGLLGEYSPSEQEAGAVAYLVSAMRELGFEAGSDGAGNAVGSLGSGPKEIMLLGHIDTVPGFISVELQGDLLYGRGSVDAKGPLATFVAAAARAGAQPGWKLTVVGAAGEEGNSPGARYVAGHYAPPAMVVIGEPSGWDHVTLGYKGSIWLKYCLQQPVAHTAARTTGACEEAVAFWNKLQARAADWNASRPKFFDQFTPTLRGMRSESDGFVDSACLSINIRLPLELSCDSAVALLKEMAGSANIEIADCTPAYRGEKNTPLVRAFLSGIRQAGGQPGFVLKTGTSDMNILGPAWGCPIVAYGPGDSDLDHTPGEHILVSEYLKGIDVLAKTLHICQSNIP